MIHDIENSNSANSNPVITIETVVRDSIQNVWSYFVEPEHIVKWYTASDDWHTPHATNELEVGGRFLFRMEEKSGEIGFDYVGTYDKITPYLEIQYTLDDKRKVHIKFETDDSQEYHETKIIETFEAEDTNPIELQKNGWQAILDHFRIYVEEQNNTTR